MPKFLQRGLLISVLSHGLLLGVLCWRLVPTEAPKPPKIEFITLEYLEEKPKEVEPQKELPRTEEPPLTPPKKNSKTKAVQTKAEVQSKAPTNAAATGSGSDASVEAALNEAPLVESGTPHPLPGEGIGKGQLALSFGDFQGIKGDLLIPRTKGKIEKNLPMEAIPSFTPSAITASNQSPLREMAAPFSAYLHLMHLRIHPLWSEGALTNFEAMEAESPVNNMALELTIEIVINEDGSLESANQIGSSGDSRYDMMAMYSIKHAAPFDAPPKRLLSYQNRVYVRWTLYRDLRECAAILAQPFWITSAERPAPVALQEGEPQEQKADKKHETSAQEKIVAVAKEAKERLAPPPSLVKSDGFGGTVTVPEHGAFSDVGGELTGMFNLSKNKSAGPPKDELTKRKK